MDKMKNILIKIIDLTHKILHTDQLEEICGIGYSWDYRWYRIRELFGFPPK
jgi:hypothetical protein